MGANRPGWAAVAVLSVLGAIALVWAVTRPPFRLTVSGVRTGYWQVWVGDHYQRHALSAKTEAEVVHWLDDARKAPVDPISGPCDFLNTANAALDEVDGNVVTVEQVWRCGKPSARQAYVSVTKESRGRDLGTLPYASPPLVHWLLSLPRQPQSVICGSWSDAPPAPPGSIGAYLDSHYGMVRQCDLHGDVWVIGTYDQHAKHGVVAVFACSPGEQRCLDGREPHPMSGWRIYAAPVGGTVIIQGFPSADCVALNVGSTHRFFDLATRRFARTCPD